METFREIVGVVRPGVLYCQKLQAEHQLAWFKVGGARHLARRLLIDGEASLRSIFHHNVANFVAGGQALAAISH